MESSSKLKVLLVDDENICHMSMNSFAKKLNVDLDGAKNGSEAVEKIKSKKYNLILMDMIMPEMDGKQAAEAIRKQADGSSHIIVAMSAGKYKIL
jgi:CheY-like chemotaxis protein